MEPIDDPPSPGSGQGSHDAHTEQNHKEPKLHKNPSGKRPISLFLPAPMCFPVKKEKRLWWSKDTVALVTGGNRGLGLEIVRQLAKEGLTVVLTARDPAKGIEALYTLKGEGLDTVVFHQLDVTSSPSVEGLADWLEKEFGGLDILAFEKLVERRYKPKFEELNLRNCTINNAGLHFYSESYEDAVETFETNYYGVKRVTNALLPLMKRSWAGARIVNVTSQAASLQRFNTCMKDKVCLVDCLSEEMVDKLATKYLEDVKAGKWRDLKKEQWATNNFQFCESKMLLNTYTQILARSLAFKQPQCHKIFVNAVCPGSFPTDMATFVVRKVTEAGQDLVNDVFQGCTIQSVEDGADTVLWLALLSRNCYPNGRYFSDKKEIGF